MRPALPLLVLLAACGPSEEQLNADIAKMEAEVDSLKQTVTDLREVARKNKKSWLQITYDQSPIDYNPKRALPKGGDKPDIILVSIDTLRSDHLGSYGYERDTSPVMDGLAAGGTRFANMWSPSSWTLPSHATMLSGLTPDHHQAIEDGVKLPVTLPFLSDALKESGYNTAGVVSTLFVSKKFGFDRGFDHFEDFEITEKKTNNKSTVNAEDVFAHGVHWAQQQPDGTPLFLFLHVYDVHYVYDAPAPHNEAFDRVPEKGDETYKNYWAYQNNLPDDTQMAHQIAQYDEEIKYVDSVIGDLVKRWEDSGRDVIIMVTADHGEEFGERNSWGHAHTLFPEQLAVPWIVQGKGIRPQIIAERVGTEDIAPTIAGLVGAKLEQVDGVDRSAQLTAGTPPETLQVPATYAETSRFESVVYRWHEPPLDLVVDVKTGEQTLCDLSKDPGCRANLVGARPAEAKRMYEALMAHLGEPWRANVEGDVYVSEGWIYQRGRDQGDHITAKPGDTFAVHPADAPVTFRIGDETFGPFRAIGGRPPESDAPVAYTGKVNSEAVTLTSAEQKMLEELGYIQDQ